MTCVPLALSLRRISALAVALMLTAAACSSDATPDTGTAAPSSAADTTDTTDTGDAAVTADAEETPVMQQLTWFVGILNAVEPPEPAELETHFSAEFLTQVPPDVFVATTSQLMAGSEPPVTIERVDEQGGAGLAAEATIESVNGVRFVVTISVGADAPHLISGLFVAPSVELLSDVTPEVLDDDLSSLAADSSLGVYDVTEGSCAPLHEIRADRVMPIGSAFKLWVLAELAHQVEQGTATWDETTTVDDRYRSSPDGDVFGLATGSTITLRRLAELMISISDNTATDHLMAHLGRRNVEGALDRIGVSAPDQNIPMLSTGALFQLKYVAAKPNADDYRDLDGPGRAALLDDLEAAVLPWTAGVGAVDTTNANGVPLTEPRDLDLEWFATPEDLCRTLVHLAELTTRPGLEPVAEILSINPGDGLPLDTTRFPTIQFKGGSEPGVITAAWRLQRNDGRQFVVVGGLSDADLAFDQTAAIVVLASAIELVS